MAKPFSTDRPAYALILTTLTQCLIVILNAINDIILARYLGPERRGLLTIVIIIPQFLSGISIFGLPSAIVYFLKTGSYDKQEIVSAGLIAAGIIGTIMTISGLIIVPFIISTYPAAIINLIEYCVLFTSCGIYISLLRQILASSGRFRLLNLASLSQPSLTLFGLIIVVIFAVLTVTNSIVVIVLAAFASVGVLAIVCRRDLVITSNNMKFHLKQLAIFCLRAGPLDIVGNLSNYSDRIILSALISAQGLGIYTVAFGASRFIQVVTPVISSVVYPSMSGRTSSSMQAIHDHIFRLLFYASVMLTLIATTCGNRLIQIAYGNAYKDAAIILPILVAESCIMCLGFMVVQLYLANGKPSYASLIEGITFAVGVASLLVLIPPLGVLGAASALLFTSITRLALLLCGLRLHLRLSLPRLYPTIGDFHYYYDRLRSG